MYKKINIFLNGVYICSTNQSRTCKEAIKIFIERPYYASINPDIVKVNIAGGKVTAHFQK